MGNSNNSHKIKALTFTECQTQFSIVLLHLYPWRHSQQTLMLYPPYEWGKEVTESHVLSPTSHSWQVAGQFLDPDTGAQTSEPTLLTSHANAYHLKSVFKIISTWKSMVPKFTRQMSEVTCLGTKKERLEWGIFWWDRKKSFEYLGVQKGWLEPRVWEPATKVDHQHIPATGENPSSIHWTWWGGEDYMFHSVCCILGGFFGCVSF